MKEKLYMITYKDKRTRNTGRYRMPAFSINQAKFKYRAFVDVKQETSIENIKVIG